MADAINIIGFTISAAIVATTIWLAIICVRDD